MFALHWICALTLALVSCLCAQPVKRKAVLLDHISDLNDAITDNCPDDMRLYSPVDIPKKECMSSALNCIIDELHVLNEECEADFDAIDSVIVELERLKDINLTSSSRNCSCEIHDQTDVKTFLENMERLVQKHNSMK